MVWAFGETFLGVESTWGKKEFFFRNRVFTLGTALEIFSQKQNKTKQKPIIITQQWRLCNAGDAGLIPGSRSSPGGGNDYALQ